MTRLAIRTAVLALVVGIALLGLAYLRWRPTRVPAGA